MGKPVEWQAVPSSRIGDTTTIKHFRHFRMEDGGSGAEAWSKKRTSPSPAITIQLMRLVQFFFAGIRWKALIIFLQCGKHMIRSRKITQRGVWCVVCGVCLCNKRQSWSPRTWKFNRCRTKLNDRASCLRRKSQTWKVGAMGGGLEKARGRGITPSSPPSLQSAHV